MGIPQSDPTRAIQRKKHLLLRKRSLRKLIAALACTATLTVIALGFVFGIAVVKGNSMCPAIRTNDFVIFNRTGSYARGDVILLRRDGQYANDHIKRIVGLPGDTVDFDEGGMLINGKPLDEPYTIGLTSPKSGIEYPIALKDNEYFVLGDNRENSLDSRNYGVIPKNHITGKACANFRVYGKQTQGGNEA